MPRKLEDQLATKLPAKFTVKVMNTHVSPRSMTRHRSLSWPHGPTAPLCLLRGTVVANRGGAGVLVREIAC